MSGRRRKNQGAQPKEYADPAKPHHHYPIITSERETNERAGCSTSARATTLTERVTDAADPRREGERRAGRFGHDGQVTVANVQPVGEIASLRDRRYRLPVLGLIVVITVVAIEAMAVATIVPTVARSLHGFGLYSWGFTAYLLADVVGMVDAGRRCDQRGPAPSLVGGLILFAAGLVVAASAPGIGVFLLGRVLQGIGGGSLIVAGYVVVARAFPEQLHRKVFAWMSAAWVIPALVGPALAGLVTSTFGWRWVFAGIVPLAIGGAALLVPVLRDLEARTPSTVNPNGPLVGLALAAGLGLLQVAAEAHSWWSLALAILAVALGVPALHRLMPTGTARLARGLPTVVALRGIITLAFFGAEAYLPLTLTRIHLGTPRVVGIPLTAAALGWSAGSWWQGRARSHPTALMRGGFTVIAIAIATLPIIAIHSVSLWVAVPIWALGGVGMGLSIPTLSVLVLELSPQDRQGANSAALQISDMTGSIIGITLIGAMVALLGLTHLQLAVTIGDLTLAAVALFGASVASRARPAT
ncbi:MAG TPA: MFS transporter [Mycobacteriales bacterium]|nr:MFS transporter [Mycobacteriales bacterium]